MSLEIRNHYTNELLRHGVVIGTEILSDSEIHSLYYGMLSNVMDGDSPSFSPEAIFSPELSPVMVAPDSEDLFESPPPSGRLVALMPVNPTASSSAAAVSSDIQHLAAAATAASMATASFAPGAASALAELASAASAIASSRGVGSSSTPARTSRSSTGNDGTSTRHVDSSSSSVPGPSSGSSGYDSVVSGTDASSSSPYYGEPPSCIVCTEVMETPGVTDGCNHRSTCVPCLWRILSGGMGRGKCPLCRAVFMRVF